MSGDTEMPGVATASYALSVTTVSPEEAGAYQGFRVCRHMALSHGCPHCMTPEGTPGVLQHGSTAMINLRHTVASAAFFPGHAL